MVRKTPTGAKAKARAGMPVRAVSPKQSPQPGTHLLGVQGVGEVTFDRHRELPAAGGYDRYPGGSDEQPTTGQAQHRTGSTPLLLLRPGSTLAEQEQCRGSGQAEIDQALTGGAEPTQPPLSVVGGRASQPKGAERHEADRRNSSEQHTNRLFGYLAQPCASG